MRERAAPVSRRYSILVSGSVRVKVVRDGQADTGCGSIPIISRDQKHGVVQVEQAATGLLEGSLLTSFLKKNKENGSSWHPVQNVDDSSTGSFVCC